MRILHVASHAIQYFSPLFRAITRQGADLHVLYASRAGLDAAHDPGFGVDVRWDVPLLEGYDSSFADPARFHGLLSRYRTIAGAIRRLRPDAVWLHGYLAPHSVAASLAARALGVPIVLREEANLVDPRGRVRRMARAAALRASVTGVVAAYIGQQNLRLYQALGLPPDRLVFAPYAVDNDWFRAHADRLARSKDELRQAFSLPESGRVLLFAGKLQAKKDPLIAVDAVAAIEPRRRPALLFAGDGELRQAVENRLAAHSLTGTVTGFLNQTELVRAYAAADALVLPSQFRETWGLVVNEAMNFGLPAVVSERVGCQPDLVQPGETGAVFVAGDVLSLRSAIEGVMEGLDGMSGQARERVASYSLDAAAAGVIAAAYRATGQRPHRPESAGSVDFRRMPPAPPASPSGAPRSTR